MEPRRILVTGASGALGHAVAGELRRRGHLVRGFDLYPARQAGDHQVGDIRDVEAVVRAAEGMEVAVHFAGVPEAQDFPRELVPNNIVGTHNLLEAARVQGLSRVVYVSSCRVVGGLDWHQERIGLDAGLVPGDHYGVSKATGELMGRMYADRFGMSVICARLGWFVRNPDEARSMDTYDIGPRIYLSHRDAKEFFRLAVEAELVGFAAVFVTSHNRGRAVFDPEPARRLLGFQPRDSWPEGSSWSEELRFESPRVAPSLLPDAAPRRV